jgi:anaerobic selenocysteine-containing dehydrogenase
MTADYRRIREHIAHVVSGCAAYPDKVRQPGGFVLPHPPRDSRTFETPSGRAVCSVTPLSVLTVPDGHLLLQSIRSHDQFNTTIYGHDDRYRGISGSRNVILVHPDDIHALSLAAGDTVDLIDEEQDGSVRVVTGFRLVPYDTPRGCAAAYYPEMNPLVPLDSTADGSDCPTFKSVVIRLKMTDTPTRTANPAAGRPVGSDEHRKSHVEPHHLS